MAAIFPDEYSKNNSNTTRSHAIPGQKPVWNPLQQPNLRPIRPVMAFLGFIFAQIGLFYRQIKAIPSRNKVMPSRNKAIA